MPEQETIREPARKVSVYGRCDVLVVGGRGDNNISSYIEREKQRGASASTRAETTSGNRTSATTAKGTSTRCTI